TAYARAVGALVAEAPTVNVAAGVSISPADLLRLIPADTTGCGPALPSPATPVLTPTPVLQDAHRLSEPVGAGGLPAVNRALDADGPPACVRSEDGTTPAPTPPARTDATGAVG